MKVLYYDLFCGISGDMNLAALVDLGVDFEYLKTELKKLKIGNEFDIVKSSGMKHGINGIKVDVILNNQPDIEYEHQCGAKHVHGDHEHQHNIHRHNYRNFTMIKDIIKDSELNNFVKKLSIEIFRLVAVAEGKVHGKPIEEVHFHEVGATDSIVDIVGAAICIDALKVDKVMASSVQVGGGFVKCAHGKMPVPAPATAEILEGVPMKYNVVPSETTTPTGAAILKATVDEFTDYRHFTIDRIGYGLGNKDFEIPNLTRVYLGEMTERQNELIVEEQFVMECNIDDMSGEIYTYVEDLLFKSGALDVYKTPIIMKKGRPATKLSVLFRVENRAILQRILLTETTTSGLRETLVTKYMMERKFRTLRTKYGAIRMKDLYMEGQKVKSKPEYEDCVQLAKEHSVCISEIYKEIINMDVK